MINHIQQCAFTQLSELQVDFKVYYRRNDILCPIISNLSKREYLLFTSLSLPYFHLHSPASLSPTLSLLPSLPLPASLSPSPCFPPCPSPCFPPRPSTVTCVQPMGRSCWYTYHKVTVSTSPRCCRRASPRAPNAQRHSVPGP